MSRYELNQTQDGSTPIEAQKLIMVTSCHMFYNYGRSFLDF